MKTVYDENTINKIYGKKVRIYFNLHKKTWSIKDKKTGLVIGYTNKIYLEDCKFIVGKSGRERVLREKRKNVHAYIDGTIVSPSQNVSKAFGYNPYKCSTFTRSIDFSPISEAKKVKLIIENKKPSQFYF